MSFSGYQNDKIETVMSPAEALATYKVTHHSDHKSFSCNLCSYSTRYKNALKRHYLVHSGERPHKCKICNRSFALPHHLKSHNLTHTGEKPYSCDVCDMAFRQFVSLKMHVKKHF